MSRTTLKPTTSCGTRPCSASMLTVFVLSVTAVSDTVVEQWRPVAGGGCGVHTSAANHFPWSSLSKPNRHWSQDSQWNICRTDRRHLPVVKNFLYLIRHAGFVISFRLQPFVRRVLFCSFLYSSYDVTSGFVCINEKQRSKQCEDYQVILTCPADFCQGKFSASKNKHRDFISSYWGFRQTVALLRHWCCLTGCRTRWFNLDNPTGRGDFETVLRLQMLYPSQVCSQPVAVEAMTVSGIPAHKTGDVFQVWVYIIDDNIKEWHIYLRLNKVTSHVGFADVT